MSVSIHFGAVPPASPLFQRVERDKAFASLMAALFPYGRGVYSFFSEMEAGEGANILRSAVQERQSRLGAEPEARRAIEEFRQELERTRAANPGIERRRCILEYTSFIVEKQLTEALKPVRAGAARFVRNLIYGDRVLGKSGAAGIESIMEDQKNTVGAVSPALVLEAAQLFHAPGAEALFASLWQVENFQDWRRLYGNAARHGEALLVGTC
jgi:hypothetical protein